MAERLSLIAGAGALVPEVIEAARNRGYDLQVLAISRGVRCAERIPVKLSDPLSIIGAIRDFNSTIVTLAGSLQLSDLARERFAHFLGAPSALSLGDGGLSTMARKLTEMTGAQVVGVHEIVPGLLAPAGLIAGPEPGEDRRVDARFALDIARQTGAIDLGQAVVVAGRRVIAVEDISGTDALLKRVQTYRAYGLVADGASVMILAKAAKPAQPHFVDLPAVGPVTIAKARKAGVRLIVVQSDATILIERQKLIAVADAAKIPVLGLPAND